MERRDRARAHGKMIDTLESKSVIPEEVARSLQAEVIETTKQCDELKHQVADLQERNDILRFQNGNHEEEREHMRVQIVGYKEENERKRVQIVNYEEKLARSHNSYDQVCVAIEQKQQELWQLNRQLLQYQNDPASNYMLKVKQLVT